MIRHYYDKKKFGIGHSGGGCCGLGYSFGADRETARIGKRAGFAKN